MFNEWFIIIIHVIINAIFITLIRFRIRTGDSLALLHVSSTTLTMGHNTSRITCPEKSNKDGDLGKLTEGIQSGEKIMDEYDGSLL